MSLPRSVAEVLKQHVTLEVEGIDRMYLNVYQPRLQTDRGVAAFFRFNRGATFASSALMDPISKSFIAAVDCFVKQEQIPLITFTKGQRKDDVTQEYRSRFNGTEGIVVVGKAQEKTPVFRTEKRRNPQTGQKYPWIVRTTAMVNHYYFYGIDENFGPFFLKICTYFPYNAKLCINGHEYVKQQLAKEGIPFEALDNGVLSCANPTRLQQLCDGLSAHKINALLRKWLAHIPHPFTPQDRAAGYRYDISILQAEFSLTQVLDRPTTGRVFFEEVIRENLDIGRPDHVQLIFERRITKQTPGRFRTRVITEGVTPSLHIDYKRSRIKQYHKEGRALRTETTINDPHDFGIGKRLSNLPALRRIGFQANRRLLDVQRISQDLRWAKMRSTGSMIQSRSMGNGPAVCASPMRPCRHCSAPLGVSSLTSGFFQPRLARPLGFPAGESPRRHDPGQMTYHLRRLRLHSLIERIPGTHRYRVTRLGWHTALFCTRTYNRLLRPGLAQIVPIEVLDDSELRRGFDQVDRVIDRWIEKRKVPA